MKRILIILAVVMMCSVLPADLSAKSLKYNPYTGKWEWAEDGDDLKYNPYENEWTYEGKDEDLEYNPYDGEWTYE